MSRWPTVTGIRRKLALLLLLVGALPLIVFGAVAIASSWSVADNLARRANQKIALGAAQAIRLHLDGVLEALRAEARTLGRARLAPSQEEQSILALRQDVHALARLTHVDRDGRVISSTDDAAAPVPPADPVLARALAGHLQIGSVTLSGDIVPIVHVALPIVTVGKVEGALLADLDLVAIWDVVDQLQVGKTGHALVLDEDGRLIAHGSPRAKALIPRRRPSAAGLALARAAAAGDGLAQGPGTLGSEVVAAVVAIPGTPWTLILEEDVAEAFGEAWRLAALLGGLALVAVAIAIFVGTRLARRSLLAPLRLLEDAAEAFGQRRFDHRVSLHTRDELEKFGHTLNEMATALARAYDDLARTERAQVFGMIAAGLAHDLKHPVGDLEAVVMRASGKDSAELDRALAEGARRAVPRLRAMVDQLRDLGRASKRTDLELPAAALLDALAGFRAAAEAKGVTLEGVASAGRRTIVADAMLLSRALENLVSNALEATPAGGRVSVNIDASGERLEIRVRDTGGGIAPELRARLFRPFASGDSARGLGLGLHVVHRVVEVHGGEIEARPASGGGTEIVAVLPVLKAGTDADRPAAGAALQEP